QHPGAVDADHHPLAARASDGAVDRGAGRGSGLLDAQVSEIAAMRGDFRRVERPARTVVDRDHLIVAGIDAALVDRRQGVQGARGFATHVVEVDDDAQPRWRSGAHARATASSRWWTRRTDGGSSVAPSAAWVRSPRSKNSSAGAGPRPRSRATASTVRR